MIVSAGAHTPMKPGRQPFWLLCTALLAVAASAEEAPSPQPANSPAEVEAPSTQSASAFKTEADKLSYALGVNAATQLRTHSLEVNPDSYAQGLRDALSGTNPLLSAAEASAVVGAKQREIATQKRAGNTPASKQLAEKNKTAGEVFLAENKTKEGVVTLSSGLQYRILRAGDGKKPALDDTVVCNYRGTLIDGTEFDSTAKRGRPATFPLRKVMKGWREVLPLMPVGSKWQVFIPPSLAYGARGAGRLVGPNSTLVFEVELLSIDGHDQTAVQRDSSAAAAVAAAGK